MANNSNFGQVLSLSGVGGVTAAYQNGPTFYAGAATFVKFKVVIVTDAASTMTSVTVKTQGLWTAGGADLGDLISYKLDTNTGQPELGHQYTGLAIGSTYTFFFECKDAKGFAGGLQVAALAGFSAGGAKAGDSVTISAAGW